MNKITYIPDNQFLLDLFNNIDDTELEWAHALSLDDIKNKYNLSTASLLLIKHKKHVAVYQYCIFLDDAKTLIEVIINKKSKGYNIYLEYLQKLDKDIFIFKKYNNSYIIHFNIIEYYDPLKNIVIYSFLNKDEVSKIFKEKETLDNTPVTVEEAIEIVKNETSNTSVNYNHVIPNSHMFSKLEQIIMAIDRNEDISFIKTGIENSIKNKYEINENHGK